MFEVMFDVEHGAVVFTLWIGTKGKMFGPRLKRKNLHPSTDCRKIKSSPLASRGDLK